MIEIVPAECLEHCDEIFAKRCQKKDCKVYEKEFAKYWDAVCANLKETGADLSRYILATKH